MHLCQMRQGRLSLVTIGLVLFVVLQLTFFRWMMRQRQQVQVSTCRLNSSTKASTSNDQQLRRPVNRVLADFRPDLAERIRRLEAANASADNPEVVRLARDVIDGIPVSAGKSPIKESLSIDQTPQALAIDNVLQGMVS